MGEVIAMADLMSEYNKRIAELLGYQVLPPITGLGYLPVQRMSDRAIETPVLIFRDQEIKPLPSYTTDLRSALSLVSQGDCAFELYYGNKIQEHGFEWRASIQIGDKVVASVGSNDPAYAICVAWLEWKQPHD
jgi:hypothetical protein